MKGERGRSERKGGISDAATQRWRGFASVRWEKISAPVYQNNTTNKCLGARTDSQQANSGYDVQSHFAQWNERHRCARMWFSDRCAWMASVVFVDALRFVWRALCPCECICICIYVSVHPWMRLCSFLSLPSPSCQWIEVRAVVCILSAFSVGLLLAPIPRSHNPSENRMWVKVMGILMYSDRCSVFRIIH